MKRGMFITFEGGEGAGKTTQINLLVESLRQKGKAVVVLREPGGTDIGEAIREWLKFPHTPLCPETELSLFIAARAQLVKTVIRPALAASKIVICDRFLDSTVVYQGFARGLPMKTIEMMNELAVREILPHITFFLKIPSELSIERLKNRGELLDIIESESLEFHEKIEKGYAYLINREPERFCVLDGLQSIDFLARLIFKKVMDFSQTQDLL